MFRLVGRASGNTWDAASSGARAASPVFKSGPVRVATPPGGVPVAESGTMRDRSTPAILPLDITPRKRRAGLVIGLLAAACVAAGAVVLVIKNRSEPATPAKPAPAPAAQPPAPVQPPPTATVDPPKREEIVTPPPIDEKPSKAAVTVLKTKQKPKAKQQAVAKKPQPPPVEVKPEPTPPPPPVKKPEDLYSKPRPDK
jgi:hypothetical protein